MLRAGGMAGACALTHKAHTLQLGMHPRPAQQPASWTPLEQGGCSAPTSTRSPPCNTLF